MHSIIPMAATAAWIAGDLARHELISLASIFEKHFGAGERDRTSVISLEDCGSTIELHPQDWLGE